MKNSATKSDLYRNQFNGKSNEEQLHSILGITEILSDAFNAAYQSEYFRLGEKQTRYNVSTLQTAFNFITKDLSVGLLDSVRNATPFDWESFEVHTEIYDLSRDIESYLDYSSAFIKVFDCFFGHDSMQGEPPESFIQKSLQIRNFFLLLLGDGLRATISNGAPASAIIYPSCKE